MYGWRGTIGLVKPTYRAGPLEAFIRFMPDGVCVVPRYVGIRAGTGKGIRRYFDHRRPKGRRACGTQGGFGAAAGCSTVHAPWRRI